MVKTIIGTTEQNQVIRKMGSLSDFDLRRVEEAVAPAIGFAVPPAPDKTKDEETESLPASQNPNSG
ncbi:MAG: hypothetical protein IT210_13590 [Armatimonadetes bacterium]|nr:hypothetical protein [Armatimonadota bacterium]